MNIEWGRGSGIVLTSNVDGVVKSRKFSIKLVGWAIAHHNWRAIASPTLLITIRRLFTSPSTFNVEWLLNRGQDREYVFKHEEDRRGSG